jgi:hypothetical protein
MQTSNQTIYRVIFLLLLLITPWLNADYSDDISPVIPSQEDMTFYEVNPCEVSLFEFLRKVPTSIYQDHFHFRYNNYSSISCFGKISGATLLNNEFYISVGTNSFVNLVIQTLFWVTVFSFIKKDSIFRLDSRKIIALLLTTSLFTYTIISEIRFYEQNFYYFDFEDKFNLILLAFFVGFALLHILRVVEVRLNSLVNYLPFIFIFYGVYSGFNLSLYTLLIIFYGLILLLSIHTKNGFIYLFISIPLVFFWASNANKRYSFKTDKLRGFINSSFDFNSNLSWSIIFILTLAGLYYIYKNTLNYVDFQKIYSNFNITTIALLLIGLLGANFPILNFLNYFYFGQQKYGVTLNNPFSYDVYEQKIAWRGVFSSSELAGEIFTLFLVFSIYIYFSQFHFKNIYYLGVTASLFGLYFSNNRAALILFIFVTMILYLSEYSFTNNKLYIIGGLSFLFLLFISWLIGFNNFTYSLEFMQNYTFSKALGYDTEGINSTFFNMLSDSSSNKSFSNSIFGLIGIFAFFLNRALMWGLFIVRYNPNFLDLMLGTGPMSFGQYFGEIKVQGINSLLLPHSSILSYLIFIGILGLGLSIILTVKSIMKNRNNLTKYSYLVFIYIFLNISKSDSLLYLQALIFYSFLFFIFIKKENVELLNISNNEN